MPRKKQHPDDADADRVESVRQAFDRLFEPSEAEFADHIYPDWLDEPPESDDEA